MPIAVVSTLKNLEQSLYFNKSHFYFHSVDNHHLKYYETATLIITEQVGCSDNDRFETKCFLETTTERSRFLAKTRQEASY